MLVENREDGDVMRISWGPVRGVVRIKNYQGKGTVRISEGGPGLLEGVLVLRRV